MAVSPPQLVGESSNFHALTERVSDLASLSKPIVITGEAGTGKSLIASRLHFLSPRWEQTYEAINCAAHDADTLEWILYGDEDTDGLMKRADGGTLYMGHVTALSETARNRLLRTVEDGTYSLRIGAGAETVNVRFVFSADVTAVSDADRVFLSRLAFDVLDVPPLRTRREDIAPLTVYFGRRIVSDLGAERFPGATPEALEALLSYAWPGNVRELKSVIERSTARAFLADETLPLPLSEISFSAFGTPAEASVPAAVEDAVRADMGLEQPETTDFSERVMIFERRLIDEALSVSHHHQGHAAEYLNLTYHQFRGLLRKHGLKK